MAEPTGNVGPDGDSPGAPRPRMTEFPGVVPDRPEDPAGYKPLSLFAILGLIISGTFAVFLLICLLVALVSRAPLVSNGFLLLWPVAGLMVSGLGWLQVRRSEGTQEGTRLAVWGVLVSVLFGLSYTAYLVGGSLAINQQADPFIMGWFDKIKTGKVEEAFIDTLPPEQRPATAGRSRRALREELSARFGGTPDPIRRGMGQLDMFAASDLTRQLVLGGPETKIAPMGVKESKYEDNGYLVRHLYKVNTPLEEAEVLVTAYGVEKKGGGWLWTVRLGADTGIMTGTRKPTPLGRRVVGLMVSAGSFLNQWVRALAEGKTADAVLMTHDPKERAKLPFDPANLEELPGSKEFREGALVKADPETFLAPGPLQQKLPDILRQSFANPDSFRSASKRVHDQMVVTFQPQPQNFRWERTQDRLRMTVGLDMTISTFNEATSSFMPKYYVDGMAVLETDAAALDDSSPTPEWQIKEIELRRGLDAPKMGPPG